MQNSTVLSRVLIGGTVSFFIVWVLMQYDMRLAWFYLMLVLLTALLVYSKEVFASLNLLIGVVKGVTGD